MRFCKPNKYKHDSRSRGMMALVVSHQLEGHSLGWQSKGSIYASAICNKLVLGIAATYNSALNSVLHCSHIICKWHSNAPKQHTATQSTDMKHLLCVFACVLLQHTMWTDLQLQVVTIFQCILKFHCSHRIRNCDWNLSIRNIAICCIKPFFYATFCRDMPIHIEIFGVRTIVHLFFYVVCFALCFILY